MKLQTSGNLFWVIFLLLLTSCQKELNNIAPSQANPKVNIYVAGYEYNVPLGTASSQAVAKLWKNGTPVNLTDGSHSAFASCVVVQGNDIYVSGIEYNDAGVAVAMYWKNGIPVKLSSGVINTFAQSMTVVGSDVYIAGFSTTMGGAHAMYWKNGNPVYLSYSTYGYSYAYSIAVSGNDVYVAGQDDVGNAVYWKNGNPVVMSGDARSLSMTIAGNDIYLAGIDFGSGFSSRNAIVWKNGTPTSLLDGTKETFASSVAVSKNDVYVAGHEFNGTGLSLAIYWKNGSLVRLSTKNSVANSVVIAENDVYIAGGEINTTETANVATYWKNGTPIYLTDGSKEAYATSIFIANQ